MRAHHIAAIPDLCSSEQLDTQPTPWPIDHVAGWEPYDLHDLARVSWFRCALWYTDPAQHINNDRYISIRSHPTLAVAVIGLTNCVWPVELLRC